MNVMGDPRKIRSLLTFCGVLFSVGVVFLLAGAWILNTTERKVVTNNAERISIALANYIGTELTRIEDIVGGASLTHAETKFLSSARKYGDVFRFKLFDRHGQLGLVSDDITEFVGHQSIPSAPSLTALRNTSQWSNPVGSLPRCHLPIMAVA